jgi:uncharacterized protein involved in oxidation of intracellular sulfur
VKLLFILNDPPYGTERTYNGLRLARTAVHKDGVEVKVFLIGDAVAAAKNGQKLPTGYYNVGTMLDGFIRHGGSVGICGSCIDARGIGDGELVAGARRSSMDELTAWTLEADKVLVF